jgi:hypothetical protein
LRREVIEGIRVDDNLPPKHTCKFDLVVAEKHLSPPGICVTNLSAGGPYWLTGTNVDVYVSGKADLVKPGEHEEIGTPIPPICLYVYPKDDPVYPEGHICNTPNPRTATRFPIKVSPDSYTYDWTLGANPKVPGSGNSFNATNSVSSPGEYTLAANFKGTVKDCAACTCYASGTTNCIVSKIEIVVDLEDPKINSVRSGLNLATIKFILNGNQIPYDKLTIKVEESEWLDGPIVCKCKVTYAPTLAELSTSPSGNLVTVDVEDNVKNAMEQQVKTFIFNSASGY